MKLKAHVFAVVPTTSIQIAQPTGQFQKRIHVRVLDVCCLGNTVFASGLVGKTFLSTIVAVIKIIIATKQNAASTIRCTKVVIVTLATKR